jgi:energy-coupling factor transporter ATP-binding protein EcfA2
MYKGIDREQDFLLPYLYPFSIYIVGSAMDTIRIRPSPEEDIETSRIEKNDKIKEIISRMHSYRTKLGFFVDREFEARSIIAGEDIAVGGMITVLYGPKGCGKSTLFRVLSRAADQAGSGLDVLVVERSEEALQKALLYLPKSFRGLGESIAGYLRDSQISPDRATIVSTSTIFGIAFTLASYIASRLRRGRRVLIVADEVKADSPEHLSNFRQWLESFANDIAEYNRIYSEKGGSIAVIALTSDALIKELRDVVGRKVDWALMWNLPRNAFEDLISQIGSHHRVAREFGISSEEAKEILWKLAGGNPRALGLIWEKGVMKWLEDEVLRNLSDLVEELRKPFGEKLWEELERASNSIDDADIDLKKAMLRKNIVIYIAGADKISEMPREQWIGKKYAYQIPAYHYALKTMAKKSTDISPEEVIKETVG